MTATFSPPPRGVDDGDFDLAHRHHRGEGATCFIAAGSEGLGQGARGDLPVNAPSVLAPAAFAFPSAMADNGVPVAVGLLLRVGGDLK